MEPNTGSSRCIRRGYESHRDPKLHTDMPLARLFGGCRENTHTSNVSSFPGQPMAPVLAILEPRALQPAIGSGDVLVKSAAARRLG